MMNKNNVPYYIAGTLAALTLLASGVFAIAPYAQFLAPVAALSVGLPLIIGGAVFSAVAIALLAVVISKNNTIFEKEAQLAGEKSKVEAKDTIISEKEKEISEKNNQLANQAKEIEDKDKTISEKEAQLAEKSTDIFNPRNQLDEEKAKEEEISKKESEGGEIVEDSSVSRLARAALVGGGATGGIAGVAVLGGIAGGMVGGIAGGLILELYVDNSKEGDVRRRAIIDNAAYGLNIAWYASCLLAKEAAKGTLYAYESTKGALGSVRSSLYSRIYGTKVSSPEKQFKREDGSKPSMQELTRLDYLDLAVPSSEQKQRANSLDYLNIDNVPKQPDHLSIDAAKRYLMSLSKDTEISSPESQPAKEENGQGWFAWSLGKAKSAMTEVVVVGADVTKPYFAKVIKALAPNLNM